MLGRILRRPAMEGEGLRSEWTRSLGGLELAGIGAVIGLPIGIFLGVPEAVRFLAGPSALLSVLVAATVALLSGAHLVELTMALPKSFPLYHAAYARLGEAPAFLLAWLTLLEYVVGAGRVARQLSAHANQLFGGRLEEFLSLPLAELNSPVWSSTFDSASLGLVAAALLLVTFSTRVCGTVSLILAAVCTLVVSSSVLVGFFYASPLNWLRSGFFAEGYLGVLRGASHISYAFVGMDAMSFLVEETKYPEKRLPAAVPLLCLILALFLFLLTLSISLALDYTAFADVVILPRVYGLISVPASAYVLSVGSVCGLCGTLVAILMPPTRILQILGWDGLLCRCLGRVSRGTGTPLGAVGVVAAAVAIAVFLRPSLGADVAGLSLPLRLLLLTLLTMAERWSVTPLGVGVPVSGYQSLEKKRGSIVDACGSVSVLDSGAVDDADSITSSFICRNIAVLQMGSQSFLPGKEDPTERSTLLPAKGAANGAVVKSVSRYNSLCQHHSEKPLIIPNRGAKEVARNSGDTASFHTVSLAGSAVLAEGPDATHNGHNCLRSPCSPRDTSGGGSPFFHLYERPAVELPYFRASEGYEPTKASQESADRCGPRLLILFAVLASTVGLVLSLAADQLAQGQPLAIAALTLPLLSIIPIPFLLHRLPVNGDSSRRKHRVPFFPHLGLLCVFLLAVLVGINGPAAFLKVGAWSALGLLVYLSWGLGHSRLAGSLDRLAAEKEDAAEPILPQDSQSQSTLH